MNTRLITPDGFPRADLDVAQSMCFPPHFRNPSNQNTVRTTRARIIYLRNDYKALMNVIEKHIHEHFARLAEEGQTEDTTANGLPRTAAAPAFTPAPQPAGPPFAKVNTVAAGSPADSAGLKVGDEIRNFGYVNHENNDGLRRVGQCVQGNEGVRSPAMPSLLCAWTNCSAQQNILIKISRAENGRRQELQLTLTPRSGWGGRGLLGCHILPL